MLQHHIRQGLNALGRDFTLFVVDFLGFFVTKQQDDGTKEEDRCTPADAVGPPELPHLPITCRQQSADILKVKRTSLFKEVYLKWVC